MSTVNEDIHDIYCEPRVSHLMRHSRVGVGACFHFQEGVFLNNRYIIAFEHFCKLYKIQRKGERTSNRKPLRLMTRCRPSFSSRGHISRGCHWHSDCDEVDHPDKRDKLNAT